MSTIDEVRNETASADSLPVFSKPTLWKLNGDELIYKDLVYPEEEEGRNYHNLHASVLAFARVVAERDKKLITRSLGLRGCIWTAGFPIRNKQIRFPSGQASPVIHLRDPIPDVDTGNSIIIEDVTTVDFIGPEMDLGFRLSRQALPGRTIATMDLCYLISQSNRTGSTVEIYQCGWRSLKGVGGGNPYPLLFVVPTGGGHSERFKARTPWERYDESSDESEGRKALAECEQLTGAKVIALADDLWKFLPDYFIRPYASPKKLNDLHRPPWLNADNVILRPIELEEGRIGDTSFGSIQQDIINQVYLQLKRDKTDAAHLREIALGIATDDSYRKWLEEKQFEGQQFRIPDRLIHPDRARRFLERFRLAHNDFLTVKINACKDNSVFLTDGLWVPQEFRVFPFIDESDLIAAEVANKGWADWAELVVDPACGCGHNLLRYRGDARSRVAFDVNTRSLSYAALNACLNEVAHCTLGINDIADGIPSFGGYARVLFTVNMPFAIEPDMQADERVLPTSASGGDRGYEKTVSALKAIAAFRDASSASCEIRAVILTYSLGKLSTDEWAVSKHAMELMGPDGVDWKILTNERLWRINGRKEQENPMPLERLALRADCRFYVRGDTSRRTAVREGYERRRQRLEALGFDHLAYGMLTVQTRGRVTSVAPATGVTEIRH